MSIKTRLSRLEEKQPYDYIVYFTIPKGYSDAERKASETRLWTEYLALGGSRNAWASFQASDDPEPQFIRCISIPEIKELLNQTRQKIVKA